MKKLILGATTLLLAASVSTSALAAAAPAHDVAVVNVQQVLKTSPKIAKLNAQLKAKFKPQQTELLALQTKVQDEAKNLSKNSTVLSDADKKKLTTKMSADRTAFLKKAQIFQVDLSKAQQGAMKSVFNELQSVITGIASQGGYAVVLDSQAALYYNKAIDLTSQVSTQFNKADDVTQNMASK